MNRNQEVVVISNIFTEDELAEINRSINDARTVWAKEYHYRLLEHHSRMDNAFHITPAMMQKFTDIAHKYGSPTLEFTYHFSFRYENKFAGKVKLEPHTDMDKTQFTIDFQLDSNADWPMYVEGKPYVLKNNEALIFSGSDQIHWRDPNGLKDGEYADMIIFHFAEPDFLDKRNPKEYMESISTEVNAYKDDYNEVFNNKI